jgi:hypothetical protein
LPFSEKLRAPEDRRLKNQGECYGQGEDTYYKQSNSSGARGSLDSWNSFTKSSEDGDKIGRKGEEENFDFEAYSQLRNKVVKDVNMLPDDIVLEVPLVDDTHSNLTKSINLMTVC